MKLLPITAIILTDRNDQRFINAVRSVAWADQVMIIDNRAGISAKAFHADKRIQIKQLPNPISDFASIRNQAMRDAKNDWVFFLDSDEELNQKSVSKLSAVVEDTSASASVLYRSDVFYGKKLNYGEAGHQPIIRLMKKDKAKYIGQVHETAQVSGLVKQLNVEILHHAHPNISEFVSDVSRYASMTASQTEYTSFWQNLLELLFFPPAKLVFGLFIQGGIIDGWRGLVYAYCMSLHSLLVRVFRYEQTVISNRPTAY